MSNTPDTTTTEPPTTEVPAIEAPAPDHAAEVARLSAVMTDEAKAAMANLTADQRAAVIKLAGDDAAKQVQAIRTLAGTWSKLAPINTAITARMPRDDGHATTAPDPKAVYETWKEKNPVWAARFAAGHNWFSEQ